ncbi:MAG: type II toxin-antitoxin system RelE/ParE family toxin [Ruminococcus sp.]|nr:type II toxin-antitoxin system RelE/ParE family toxin [Ruminococcus sp.]
MYKVEFYKNKDGKEPVKEYIIELSLKKDKNSRINLNKIRDYIKTLSEYGTRAGEPYVKHLDGDIWELRPLRNRILFFGYDGNRFILLSHFIKKTQKTPRREIDKAQRLMKDYKDYMERSDNDEK